VQALLGEATLVKLENVSQKQISLINQNCNQIKDILDCKILVSGKHPSLFATNVWDEFFKITSTSRPML
jgi:hypothetical protein